MRTRQRKRARPQPPTRSRGRIDRMCDNWSAFHSPRCEEAYTTIVRKSEKGHLRPLALPSPSDCTSPISDTRLGRLLLMSHRPAYNPRMSRQKEALIALAVALAGAALVVAVVA